MPDHGGRLTIVVGITGGIAAYKAVNVVRQLVLAGHDVHVVPTPAALRFVGTPTLEAISRNPVTADLYEGVAEVRHVALGQAADLIVIAPATANSLAKLAVGLADDLLGTTVLASTAPIVVAPAMHSEMWANAATRANVRVLEARGVHIVGPVSGQLTGRDSGQGRMAEPADIVAAALAVVHDTPRTKSVPVPAADHLAGKRVLITAGGTREPLDPVRFVGNRSSGALGVALAEAARDRGAMVTLLAAHLEVPEPAGVHVVHVGTTEELRTAALEAAPEADLIVMAAAVADYRPVGTAEAKLKKRDTGATFTLELVQNPDVLHDLVGRRASDGSSGQQTIVGFAAETEPDRTALIRLGRDKIARKGCDFLVLNEVGWHAGFGPSDTSVVVIDAVGAVVGDAAGGKSSVAGTILDLVAPA